MKPAKPKEIWALSFEPAWTTSVAFLGNHQQLAAGDREGRILIWELPTDPPKPSDDEEEDKDAKEGPVDFAPVKVLQGHTNAITHLIALPDGKSLLSASYDGTVRLWDLTAKPTGKTELVLDMSKRESKARRLRSEEKQAVLEAPGVELEVIEAHDLLSGHQNWVKALGISADGRRAISGDDDCLTIVWDLAARKEIARWHGYNRVWVTAAALSPNGKLAFTTEYASSRGSFDRPAAQVRLWEAETGDLKLDVLKVWTPKVKDESRVDSYGYAQAWGKLMGRGLICAAFSPDGKLIVAGQGGETGEGKFQLIDVATGKIIRTFGGHKGGACDCKFSADGNYVVTGGRDTEAHVYQVSDGKSVATLGTARGGQFKDWIHAVSISPDQQWVAGADIAGLVHLWKFEG